MEEVTMQTVFKYPISMTSDVRLNMPEDAKIVQVGLDNTETPCVWALVDPDAMPTVKRKFGIYGTGGRVPDNCAFVDTFFQMPFVWHVFEELAQ
jgi:hypothetical protein